MRRIRAVSFDAGGTLIGIAEPVGVTYARFARAAGFPADADALDEGFRRAFATAPPLAPTAGHAATLLEFELSWWRAIVAASLGYALCEDVPPSRAGDLERFFAATFAWYAEPAAWRLLPDAAGAVRELDGRGLRLAVLSNFDRRLHGLIDAFGLCDAFSAIVPSSEAGAAKPARGAFDHVRRQLSGGGTLAAGECLHVGDSVREDVAGALGAGWRAVWIDRHGHGHGDGGSGSAATTGLPDGAARITTLHDLSSLAVSF